MSDDDTRGLRPSLKPWILGAVINLALAGVLLGIPYTRGSERAETVAPRFAAFAACFYDAEPLDEPGLGLPRGERGRFASLVVSGPDDWPGRCVAPLRAIPPEESRFLFPGVKNAEAQLRAAVGLMATELEALAAQRADGSVVVPHRPTRAMAALRGALAELGLSSGVGALSADRDAIALDEDAHLATPSIIPLRVSRGGEWRVAADGDALLASTMDSRAAVHVRVAAGGVGQRVTRRPRLLSAMLGGQEPPWLVWSTSRAQCDATPDGCARRSSGLAAFLEDRQTLEPMVWVAAHPALPPARAIHVTDRTAYVVAEAPSGVEVRRFALPEPEVRPLGEEREPPRLAADASWVLGRARTAAWLDGSPPRLLLAGARTGQVLDLSEGAAPTLFELAGRVAVATSCGRGESGWLAAGTEHGSALVSPSGGVIDAPQLRLDPPTEGALDLACAGDVAWLLGVDRGRLRAVRCEAGDCSEPVTVQAAGVRAFDAALRADELFVAWTDDAEQGPVRVSRLAVHREPVTSLPAPCWTDPMDGLCGEPRLVASGERLFLVTRQGEDLRVLESLDGATFTGLQGLEQP